MNTPPRKLAIATGGGDCPGLNAVIRAVVLRAHAAGLEVLGVEDGLNGLLEGTGATVRALTPIEVAPILGRGGTVLGTTNRCSPFAWRDGKSPARDRGDELLARAEALGIDLLINVGGDGSQAISLELARRGLPVIGVPKTIDNDLEATDYTVGFQTAVEVVTEALERLHTTAESHERIMIVEVMGRYAGWIALTSALAGAANVCLIPEIEYDIDRVIEAFHRRHGRGVSYSIVVCAEGAKAKGGAHSVVTAGDVTKQEKLGGAAQRLADLISARTEYEVRTTVLGHVQRGGAPCAFDRELATRFGVKAVELIAEGKFGHVAALENGHLVAKPIEKAVKKLKLVDPAGELVRTAKGIGIELGG